MNAGTIAGTVRLMVEAISKIKPGPHWNIAVDRVGHVSFQVQADTQEKVRRIRAVFPGVIWRKQMPGANFKWWGYKAKWVSGSELWIYAVYEAPPTCKARTETRIVKKQVPIEFEEQEVEETVTVWDCGEDKDAFGGDR